MTATGNQSYATRLAARSLLKPVLLAVAVAVVAAGARRYFVEPESIAFACEPNPWQGWCAARSLLIQTFAQGGLGWASLGAAALALASGALLPAYAALLIGMAGLIFYCYEFAAVGALAAALVLVRKLSHR